MSKENTSEQNPDNQVQGTQSVQEQMSALDEVISQSLVPNADGYIDESQADNVTKLNKPAENKSENSEKKSDAQGGENNDNSEDDNNNDDQEYIGEDDYDLMIKMPDGQAPISVGDLKNIQIDAARNTERTTELDGIKLALDTDRKLVMDIANTLEQLTPEQSNAIQAQQNHIIQREKALLMEAIPEWKHEQAFNEDRKNMLTTIERYGISEVELDSASDSRMVRLVNDYTKLLAKVADAEAQLKTSRVKDKTRNLSRNKKPKGERQENKQNDPSIAGQMSALDDLNIG